MKKPLLVIGVALLALSAFTPALHGQCTNLPAGPVTALHGNYPGTLTNSFFDITLSGVGDGYYVSDGMYPGWCIEDNHQDNTSTVTLHCSLDDPLALPGNLGTVPWDKLNYLLNHKQGNIAEIQAAIWLLVWGKSESFSPTATSYAMLNDANANGVGYVPGCGEKVAIALYTGDGGIGWEGEQESVIEVPAPCEPTPTDTATEMPTPTPTDTPLPSVTPTNTPVVEGCTPGYWRNHLEDWVSYAPGDYFDVAFGVGRHITLLRAVNLGGGGERALIRHATAALLNAAHPDVDYAYTVAQVISIVQNAYATGGFAAAKNMFAAQNEGLCQIN